MTQQAEQLTPGHTRRALLLGLVAGVATVAHTADAAATDDPTLHLLRRATHGPAPVDWLAVQALGGPAAWLDDQLAVSSDAACDAQIALRFPAVVLPPKVLWAQSQASLGANSHVQVAAAHLLRQLTSTRQVYEQVVDVFFNRLNVPFTAEAGRFTYPSYYNDVIRAHAFGRYADMVAAMVRHGTMLQYLNADRSDKLKPNENLGRELLELHTVGVAARFTEPDVRQTALVLTGLSVDDTAQEYSYKPAHHYVGKVTVLGWSSANATPEGGEAVALSLVDYLTHHPACARRIATTLATRFVSDTPSPQLVADLAKVYLANDTAIVPVLTALFAHPEFAGATGAKLRRPSQQAIAFARTCGVRGAAPTGTGPEAMLWALYAYGDALLNQPSPDGLPDVAASWLSSQTRLAALDSAGRTLDGWGAGLSTPDALSLRPGLPRETGGDTWTPLTTVTAGQVVDALSLRHLGQLLPQAHRSAVARAAGWDLKAPAATLMSFDAGLAPAVALLAGHPLHTAR